MSGLQADPDYMPRTNVSGHTYTCTYTYTYTCTYTCTYVHIHVHV